MLKVCKKISVIFLLLISGCAYFQETPVAYVPTEREQLFSLAENFYISNNDEEALPIYFKISRNPEGDYDPIYDQSLWRLVKIYEKNDQSEKALLNLEELLSRHTDTVSKYKIKFSQMKNHFRVSNDYQAVEIRKELDRAFKTRQISLEEIYACLVDSADFIYDHKLIEELAFLGEVQKYFVFIMESNLSPQNERITELLLKDYERFFAALAKDTLSAEYKRKLSVSLLDQLRKFDQYQLIGDEKNPTLLRFASYSEEKQKVLVERLNQ